MHFWVLHGFFCMMKSHFGSLNASFWVENYHRICLAVWFLFCHLSSAIFTLHKTLCCISLVNFLFPVKCLFPQSKRTSFVKLKLLTWDLWNQFYSMNLQQMLKVSFLFSFLLLRDHVSPNLFGHFFWLLTREINCFTHSNSKAH